MDYLNAGKKFIQSHFSECSFALVAGSVVRDEATITSDLDIFIIDKHIDNPYRESFYQYGWPIEAFIHTVDSYKEYFNNDAKRRRPSLPKMCSEGIMLKDDLGLATEIKKIANDILEKVPEPFSSQEIASQRYAITDMLDDLIGAEVYEEELFIINELSEKIINFILVNRGHWMGRGKWLPKLLKKLDEELYIGLIDAMNTFYKENDKQFFIDFVTKELNKYGGRLFEGYRVGK